MLRKNRHYFNYFVAINRKKAIEQQPALSIKQQRVNYYVTIIGTITSALLAAFSIYLTHKISQTSTKVDKMDSLIQLMSIQNQRQNEQLLRLREIQEVSIGFSKKMSDQIISTHDQTAFLQNSYSPDITLTKIDFSKSNMKEEENILSYQFINTGGRTLKNLHSKLFMFLPTVIVQDSIYFLGAFTPTIFDGNTTDLKPNTSNFHFITIPTDKILDSIFKVSSMAIAVDYIDPLTKKKFVKTFLYRNLKGLDGRLLSIYATPKHARIMNRFLDTSRIFQTEYGRFYKAD